MKLYQTVQIAGVVDLEEALTISALGADSLGFPLSLPDGRQDLDSDQAASIIEQIPAGCTPVIITYFNRASDISSLLLRTGAQAVQLHADISTSEVSILSRAEPSPVVVKSLIVGLRSLEELAAEAADFLPYVSAFILDSYDAAAHRRGATGITHDWRISRELVRMTEKPVILAGGLDEDNVARAIREVAPAGVDAHTRLEGPDGRKDPQRTALFISRARQAFVETSVESFF